MNRIISLETTAEDFLAETQSALEQYPAEMQSDVRNAFQAAGAGEFDKSTQFCLKLLEYKPDAEIRMLLGTNYFMQAKLWEARNVFSDLTQDYPGEERYLIYMGMTDHGLGRFKEAVKELGSLYPLKVYRPFFYTSYGDSLLQLGRLKQSRSAFYKEAAFFKQTGIIVSPVMLDGAFENLLYLDITLGNGKYPEDIKLYNDFLERIEMTEEMQDCLAGNIVYFCELMRNKWYRPLFLDFITHIREKGYLKGGDFSGTLDSAFASWESFQYHEDYRVNSLMETYLAASYERKYSQPEGFSEDDMIEKTALTYEWYMCQYAPGHPKEIDYIKEKYPYTYEDNRAFFEKVKNNPENTAEEILDKLLSYMQDTSGEEFAQSMHLAYQRACEDEKEPVYVYDGMDTYRRIQPKVGRNDPCPCGSGKKYKKCCGR